MFLLLLATAMPKGSRLATVDYSYSKKEVKSLLYGDTILENRCLDVVSTGSQWQLKDTQVGNSFTLELEIKLTSEGVKRHVIVVKDGETVSSDMPEENSWNIQTVEGGFTLQIDAGHPYKGGISEICCLGIYKGGIVDSVNLDNYLHVDNILGNEDPKGQFQVFGAIASDERYARAEDVRGLDERYLKKGIYEEIEIDDKCYTVSGNLLKLKNQPDLTNVNSLSMRFRIVKEGGETVYIDKVVRNREYEDGSKLLIDDIEFNSDPFDGNLDLNINWVTTWESICIESLFNLDNMRYLPGDSIIGNVGNMESVEDKERKVFSAPAADARFAPTGHNHEGEYLPSSSLVKSSDSEEDRTAAASSDDKVYSAKAASVLFAPSSQVTSLEEGLKGKADSGHGHPGVYMGVDNLALSKTQSKPTTVTGMTVPTEERVEEMLGGYIPTSKLIKTTTADGDSHTNSDDYVLSAAKANALFAPRGEGDNAAVSVADLKDYAKEYTTKGDDKTRVVRKSDLSGYSLTTHDHNGVYFQEGNIIEKNNIEDSTKHTDEYVYSAGAVNEKLGNYVLATKVDKTEVEEGGSTWTIPTVEKVKEIAPKSTLTFYSNYFNYNIRDKFVFVSFIVLKNGEYFDDFIYMGKMDKSDYTIRDGCTLGVILEEEKTSFNIKENGYAISSFEIMVNT